MSQPETTQDTRYVPPRSITSGEHVVHGLEGTLVVVDHHVTLRRAGSGREHTLQVSEIRRVQLDIELDRPATIAIVPNSGKTEAHVLTVEASEFEVLTRAMLHLAVDLADVSRHLGKK